MGSYNIILIAAEPWRHYTWRRRHHVAWNLAKNHRVLFVEPPLTVLNPFRDINLSWKHLLNLGRLKYQGRNLYSYSPWRKYFLSLPFSGMFDYEKMNQNDVAKQIQKVVKKLGFKNPILWVYFHPYHYDYYGLFNEKMVVADWYDKFTAQSGRTIPNNIISKIKDREDRILQNADIVFAVSKGLLEDTKKVNDNCYLIPNGVDYDLFENPPTVPIPDLELIRKPTLGYLGILHYKVDFDLLNYVAESRPDWSILLMGREWIKVAGDRARFKALSEKKNVHYVGEISRDKIPTYLQYVDVCLMPMKKIEFNRYADPLKLWEYLATGKPVVAVDQGIKYDHYPLIKVASDKEGFIHCIEEALREDNPELVAERKRVARENSWDKRVDKMMELIEAELQSHVH